MRTPGNKKNQTVLRFASHSQETVAILHSLPSAASGKHSQCFQKMGLWQLAQLVQLVQ